MLTNCPVPDSSRSRAAVLPAALAPAATRCGHESVQVTQLLGKNKSSAFQGGTGTCSGALEVSGTPAASTSPGANQAPTWRHASHPASSYSRSGLITSVCPWKGPPPMQNASPPAVAAPYSLAPGILDGSFWPQACCKVTQHWLRGAGCDAA